MRTIRLPTLPEGKLVIDIGGGGEGFVSRSGVSSVCAVDVRMDKILEAQIYTQTSQWLCADACSLCFQDESADVVTFWFSLAFIRERDRKEQALREAYRVLKPDGTLSLLGMRIDTEQYLDFNGEFILPNGEVSRTGFRVSGGQDQTLESVRTVLQDVGFVTCSVHDRQTWFSIEAKK
ncbi:MAG: hypothetical protein DRP09_14520 [Candidatus Thorarchaeota archaeon]|nr:MAG: hypothetical protein DRP09_14520 [Candidatus Thorarchaeota archaeon]